MTFLLLSIIIVVISFAVGLKREPSESDLFWHKKNKDTQSEEKKEETKEEKVFNDTPSSKGGCLSGCFTLLLIMILMVCGIVFIAKKYRFDYNGEYASERIIYDSELGFCKLITYYPEYQKDNSKGFAIANIPFGILLAEEQLSEHDAADSEEIKIIYQNYQWSGLLGMSSEDSIIGKKGFESKFSKALLDYAKNRKSYEVGNRGHYYVIQAKDVFDTINRGYYY